MEGIYHVLSTPFTPDGSIDQAGLRKVIRAAISDRVSGFTVLGVTGEAHKLTLSEQRRILSTVREEAPELPIVVGCSRNGVTTAVEAIDTASEFGASHVMMTPPNLLGPGNALTSFFREVGDATGASIMLQDFPEISGVNLASRDIADLVESIPQITSVKLEGRPTGRKAAEVLTRVDVPILGGLGGTYMLSELQAGARGAMTGFPYPGVLVDIWEQWNQGDHEAAAKLYFRYLPAFVSDGQPVLGVPFRKYAQVRRGLIGSDNIRSPGASLQPDEKVAADQLLDLLGL